MIELKKILTQVFVLFLDIVLLIIPIIEHIILPNRNRKGNILNSLFIFFTGTVEILNRFEQDIFQGTKIFKYKYIRQGVIIMSTFLFLLASFEWTKGQEINTSISNAKAVQLQPKVFKSISFHIATKATDCLNTSCCATMPLTDIGLLPSALIYSPSVKRYLLIRRILI